MCVSIGDAEPFGINTVHQESADDGPFITENTHYAFFISGRTSTNASDTPFSTGIPFDTRSPYGSEIPFSKNTMRLMVDSGSAYAPGTPFCTGPVTKQIRLPGVSHGTNNLTLSP